MPSALTSIAYFVPEFPGQTHIFFWRERQALRRLGIEPKWVSTRKPPRAIVSHSWAAEAMAETEYLFPPRADQVASLLRGLVRAAPAGLARCLQSVARAEGLDARGRARLLTLVAMGARLAELARERGWSHVHAHSCADAANVAMFAHLLSGITYSITLHGPLRDYGPNQREKWRHASLAIVITRRLYHEVQEELRGSLPPELEIAPMGVDTERFNRRNVYEAWHGQGPLRVFTCGRLNLCKGHDHLIEAISILRARGLDATLEIAGEDEAGGTTYRKTLEAQIAQAKLGASVSLLGAVSEERVRTGLETSHVFVLASLAEPLGVAIMEAMAMEIPVVATDAGGVPELIDHGRDGILVPPSNPTKLADAIESLARDPDAARRFAAAGRSKVETQFHSDRSAEVLARHVLAKR